MKKIMILALTSALLSLGACTSQDNGNKKDAAANDNNGNAAIENLLLAAHALGLGAVWTGCYPIPERVDEVSKVLNCPKNIVPLAVVRIGYPDEAPAPKDKFKEENISYNTFGGKQE